MKALLSLVSATVLLVAPSHGQTTTSSSPITGGAADATSTNSTTNEARGTVVEYSPGASLVVNTGTGEPLHFRFGKSVIYKNDEGRAIEPAMIRKNFIVRVQYTKEGNDMVIDKLILSD